MNLLEAIRTFRDVAERGSFSEAGRRSGRPKAAVSRLVGDLERYLGVRLLHRTTRRVALTETGRQYLARAAQLLTDLEDLHGEMRDAQGALGGRLRVTAPQTFGELFLVPLFAAFTQREPAVGFDLLLTDRFVDLVEERIDLAIRIGELPDSSLVARRLADMHLVVCASPDYLASHPTPPTPRALEAHDCIIDTNLQQPRQWPFDAGNARYSVAVDGRLAVNSPRAARDLARAGAGIAMLPDFVVRDDLARGTLVQLFAAQMPPARGIYAVYPHRRYVTRRLRVFVEFLAAALAAPPG